MSVGDAKNFLRTGVKKRPANADKTVRKGVLAQFLNCADRTRMFCRHFCMYFS